MLFAGKQHFFCYPFRVFYLTIDPDLKQPPKPPPQHGIQVLTHSKKCLSKNHLFNPFPAKCLISAPSKRFKRAVDRNRIKRLTREAYRKNKNPFYAFLKENNLYCLLAFIYSASDILPYDEIESKMAVSLQQLTNLLQAKQSE